MSLSPNHGASIILLAAGVWDRAGLRQGIFLSIKADHVSFLAQQLLSLNDYKRNSSTQHINYSPVLPHPISVFSFCYRSLPPFLHPSISDFLIFFSCPYICSVCLPGLYRVWSTLIGLGETGEKSTFSAAEEFTFFPLRIQRRKCMVTTHCSESSLWSGFGQQ